MAFFFKLLAFVYSWTSQTKRWHLSNVTIKTLFTDQLVEKFLVFSYISVVLNLLSWKNNSIQPDNSLELLKLKSLWIKFGFSVDTFWFALLWFGVTQQGKGLFPFFSGDFCYKLQMSWSIFWDFFKILSEISIKSCISFKFPAKFLTCISFWALEMGSGLRKKMGWGSILIRLCFCLLCPALNIFWSRPLSKPDIYY